MRTSVPGRCSRGAPGFTLIELLVTLAVIALATTLITVSLGPGQRRDLGTDAERLAVLLSAAREEALVRGRPVRLAIDDSGYRFLVLADRQWRPFDELPLAQPRRWEGPTTPTVTRSDGRTALEFGREPVDVPFLLVLEREGARVAVAGNGLGRFEVLR